MNRYEFEDKISDYIDNQLSVSERKDFEDFLNSDNEAKELVESVRKTIKLLSSAETVKSSNEFLPNLTSRIFLNDQSKKLVIIFLDSPQPMLRLWLYCQFVSFRFL